MRTALDKLPTAEQAMEQLTITQLAKDADAARQREREDAEKKALVDRLTRPSGVSDEEALKRVASIIQRAVKNGLGEVEIIRFRIASVMTADAPSQRTRSWLGKHSDRSAEGNVRVLEPASPAARV